MGEHHEAVLGLDGGRDVLGRVPRRLEQPDRRRQLEPLGLPVDPQVVAVPRPVVVHPGLREQRGVERVIGMVVRQDHVRDRGGDDLELGERTQDRVLPRHQPGVHDDQHAVVPGEPHRRCRAVLGVGPAQVALEQDPDLGSHRVRHATTAEPVRARRRPAAPSERLLTVRVLRST
jgi:hypothetical protein